MEIAEPVAKKRPAFKQGDILAGKYRLERMIGQGGMGLVFAATHVQLKQRVAIKLLLREAKPAIVERFLREARAAVRLKSEHVARVIDVGELADGAPFMVMEYLEGSDVAAELRRRGPLPIEEAVEYVLHACEGIAEAHAAGIVHRDLKPSNLFLTTAVDGTKIVKVLDFGISKELNDEPGAALTQTEDVLGSPLFMSPEQMRSARSVDARTDIWSMGAILYQLLTMHTPFEGNTYPEVIYLVTTESPPRPSTLRPDLPPALEAVILRCLERDMSKRLASAAELAAAIAPFGPSHARISADRTARILGASQAPKPEPAIPSGGASLLVTAGTPEPSMRVSVLSPMNQSVSTNSAQALPELGHRNLRNILLATAGILLSLGMIGGLVTMRMRSSEKDVAPKLLAPSSTLPAPLGLEVHADPSAAALPGNLGAPSVSSSALPLASVVPASDLASGPHASASASRKSAPATRKPATSTAEPSSTAPKKHPLDVLGEVE